MNENQAGAGNLIDATDCLEAVGVFRGWKNFLFAVLILCILLLQLSFWLINCGCIKAEDTVGANEAEPPQTGQSQLSIPSPNEPAAPAAEPNRPIAEPNVAAATADVNVPEKAGEASREGKVKSLLGIRIKHASWLIRFADIVFIFAATLYCLTMLFILKVSLIGRLGGISHICRAFFLSMVMLVLILPWQKFFGSVVVGATYPPHELLEWLAARTGSRLSAVLFYLRFVGYWVLILLLLILSQLRSCRWTKAILRRLEVI